MSTLTKTAVALSVAAAGTAPALAQDEPFEWTGFYIGAHGAVLDGSSSWTGQNIYNTFDGPEGSAVSHTETIAGAGSDTPFGGGVRLGANFQTGQLVFGIEGDITFIDYDSVVSGPSNRYRLTTSLSNVETLRARAGFDAGGFLIYATGGVAWANLEYSATTAPGLSKAFSDKSGYTFGGGIEAALGGNWTANLMYLYMDFGTATGPTVSGAGESIAPMADTNFSAGMLSINFHF